MTNLLGSKTLLSAVWISYAILCTSGMAKQATVKSCENGIALQIVPDKSVYSPGEVMRIKFIIDNTSEKSYSLFRYVSQCSGPFGWFSIKVFDKQNRDVGPTECSAHFNREMTDITRILRDPKSGLELQPGEIYGRVLDYKAPSGKGYYRLEAEIVPAGLDDDQTYELSTLHINVLKNVCRAPVITILVK